MPKELLSKIAESTGVGKSTVAKGIKVEKHDHPKVSKEHPKVVPQLVKDELKLDKKAYAKDGPAPKRGFAALIKK
jgi:hypothetical protein